MGSKTIIFFALAAFLTIQVSAVPAQPKDTIQDLMTLVQNALLAVNSAVRSILGVAENAIEGIVSDADKIKDMVMSEATKLINAVGDEIVKTFDELKANNTDAGLAVIDCFEAEQKDIQDGLAKAIDTALTCGEESNIAVLNAADTILKDLDKYNDQLKEHEALLGDCTSDNLLTCLADILSKIVEGASKIPTEMKDDVDAAVAALKAAVDNLPKCIGVGVSAIEADGIKIIDTAAACIQDKIKG